MRKLLGWVLLALVVFFVVKNPTGAAHIAHALAAGVGDFLSTLVGGGSE